VYRHESEHSFNLDDVTYIPDIDDNVAYQTSCILKLILNCFECILRKKEVGNPKFWRELLFVMHFKYSLNVFPDIGMIFPLFLM